jgi:hypothetical protein
MNNTGASRYVIISVTKRAAANGSTQTQYWIERDGIVLKRVFDSLKEAANYVDTDKRRSRVIGFRTLPLIQTLALILALAIAGTAHADLGDTYKDSCERYGGVGTSDDSVRKLSAADRARYGERVNAWKLKDGTSVVEVFKKDQCVCITYLPAKDAAFTDLWVLLGQNARKSHEWHQYDVDYAQKAFVTQDNRLFAVLTHEGMLVILYKNWGVANYSSLVNPAPDRYTLPSDQRDGALENALNSTSGETGGKTQ